MNTATDQADARALQRRLNNFLTVCMTHAEAALQTEDPQELVSALRWILESARAMAPHAPCGPNGVQHALPFEGAHEASSALRARGVA